VVCSIRLLPTWDFVRTIARFGKVGAAIVIPVELLRSNGPRAPTVRWILHAMIDNPVLGPVWRCSEAGVTDTVPRSKITRLARILDVFLAGCYLRRFTGILVEDRVGVLAPVARVLVKVSESIV
jgi:hypothetical protein